MNFTTMLAIFKRDFRSYFVSLTGYVFILVFVVLATVAAFRPLDDLFYTGNKATLDLLSAWYPILLVFIIPGVTMASWAREKERGTDNLLLTLPAHDHEIVLAKYTACLGVFTVFLLFTLPLVGALSYLGDPDWGLMLSTYLGYWLAGAAAVALAMLGSALVNNLTLAWLMGAVFCALPALPDALAKFLGLRVPAGDSVGVLDRLGGLVVELGALRRFEAFGTGVVALEDVVYFLGILAAALYANAYVLGRRHWTTNRSRMVHQGFRLASLAVITVSLVVLGGRAIARADLTAEKMLSLTPETLRILDRLEEKDDEGRYKNAVVYIQAWISPEVPDEYRATRESLVRMLREFDSRGGQRLQVAINDTKLYSKEAQQAEKNFEIRPRTVEMVQRSRVRQEEIFLGLALTCGPRQVTIPFLFKGLPIQYELTRAIGTLLRVERRKVGVLKTQVDMFGGFNFQAMSSTQDWEFLRDLRKQYEVEKVEPKADIKHRDRSDPKQKDEGVDVLVVPLPNTLQQVEMDRLGKYLFRGGRALLLCDALPFLIDRSLNMAPMVKGGGPQNPMMRRRQPPTKPKGNIKQFLGMLGITWHIDRLVWDEYNPHPQWDRIPPQYVFVAPPEDEEDTDPFEEGKDGAKKAAKGPTQSGFGAHPISSGLQELVMIFPGEFEYTSTEELKITPLLTTRRASGYHGWRDIVSSGMMGGNRMRPNAYLLNALKYESKNEYRVLAVAIEGILKKPSGPKYAKWGVAKPFKAVVVADADMISDPFYGMRRQGSADFILDNVTFAANAIDWLAGEEELIELRKLRPKHRTLTRIEKVEKAQKKLQRKAIKEARESAEKRLEEAKKSLDEKVKAIKEKEGLDWRTRLEMIKEAQDRENRVYAETKRTIEDEKKAAVRLSETEKKQEVEKVQRRTTLSVMLFSPLPALLLGLLVLIRKFQVEQASIDPERRKKALGKEAWE